MYFLLLLLLLEKERENSPNLRDRGTKLNSHYCLAHTSFHKLGTKTPLTFACRWVRTATWPTAHPCSDPTLTGQGSFPQLFLLLAFFPQNCSLRQPLNIVVQFSIKQAYLCVFFKMDTAFWFLSACTYSVLFPIHLRAPKRPVDTNACEEPHTPSS